ncbi:bromodomain and WD repeat-containing protein 3-like [Styela clava]
MSSGINEGTNRPDIELDLYFLIARFLSQGPCTEAAKTLILELEKNGLLHKDISWTGETKRPTFEHSLSTFRDISPDFLFQVCQRLGPLLNNSSPPSSVAKSSICGAGRYSFLRNEKTVVPTRWSSRSFSACVEGRPLVPPHNFSPSHNWALGIFGREHGGTKFKNLLRPTKTLYGKMKLHRRVLGHLSSVYCILYDRTGSRIFTGSDDCLIKCWSSNKGRLLSTFRGHQSEICDMDISYENTILASASCDKEIRIWDIRSGKPITILQSHSAMITSIEFSALVQGETRYLISTGRDGNVCFWIWNSQTLEFATQPIKFQERNRPGVAMLCSSCSAGGRFIAVGGSDNLVHIYQIPFECGATMIGPMTIAEQDEHNNTVDSIWFSHNGLRLISGSKDGTARVWSFEFSTWTSLVLDVSRTFDSPLDASIIDSNSQTNSKTQNNNNASKINVTMVAWDCNDENVMTSLTDYTIKVWNSVTRKLQSILKGHKDEAYCLEPHPNDKRILLSAGHDGNVFLWNVDDGSVIMNFHNMLEGLGHGAVFDAKFSRDGNSFACTDSHGHLLLFGFGDGKPYTKSPVQQFFHTDYRPLIRDQHGYVLDEQTQQAPHLMPPPFLVDVDGNPYPTDLQRLVPGREHANDTQTLLPDFLAEQNGLQSPSEDYVQQNDVENVATVVESDHDPAARSVLDTIIEQMQRVENGEGPSVQDPAPFSSPSSTVGLRREGDLAGVRQMHRNAPRSQVASVADIVALTQRVITPQFSQEESERHEYLRQRKGASELLWHRKERRKRRPISNRRQSRDTTNQPGFSKTPENLRKSSQRRARSNFYKEDPEDEQEQPRSSSRHRLIRRMRAYAHGYSTRSRAPRRRMSSVAESINEELDNNLEEIEEHSTSASGETSDFLSSEEDFSQKAKIIRRSKRKKNSKRKKKVNGVVSDVDTSNLRRSVRHRRAPKRLVNSSEGGLSETDDETAENTASTGSLFLSPSSNKSKHTKRKEIRKARAQRISSVASSRHEDMETSEDEERPSTSANCQSNKKVQLTSQTTSNTDNKIKKPPKKEIAKIPFDIIPGQPPPPMYLAPDWIKRVTPSHFPYVPQMEDEIVYLRQGHEAYISKVINDNVWPVVENELCYNLMNIGHTEPCKVIEIEYIIGPPTRCEICLLPLNQKVSKKSKKFKVQFHDMPNVVDFLILKDKYDTSVSREWNINDRFRSIIDDTWWYGTVVDHSVRDPTYPDSYFQSFSVLWDSENNQEELDYLSPWDMEPIPQNISNLIVTRSQNHVSSSNDTLTTHALIGPKELRNVISYRYKRSDWSCDEASDSDDSESESVEKRMVKESSRIATAIQALIDEKEFTPFASPVNVSIYPLYTIYVAFPTDLSTIQQRLQNRFYRRSAAFLWEVSYLEKNANAFNEPDSEIVKRAEFLCSLLMRFVQGKSYHDIIELQHEMEDVDHETTDSEADVSEDSDSSVSSIPSVIQSGTEDEVESINQSQGASEYATTAEEDNSNLSWIEDAKKLLDDVLDARDSRPFRSRVAQHEDDTETLDLVTIQNKLLTSGYTEPKEFFDDVTLMFSEFKKSNQSREGRSMMARLSPLMSSRINTIIKDWKKNQSKACNGYNGVGVRRSKRRIRRLSSDLWSPNSKSVSQDSDSFAEPRARKNPNSAVGAYPTRQMLRRRAKKINTVTENGEEEVQSINSRQNHRKLRGRRLQTVDSDEAGNNEYEGENAESSVANSNHTDESTEINNEQNNHDKQECSTRAKKRKHSDRDEIGQGDAALSIRQMKRQKKMKSTNHESTSESEKGNDSDCDFTINQRVQKNKKHSKTNGHVSKQEQSSSNKHSLRPKRQKPTRYNDYSDLSESETETLNHQNTSSELDNEPRIRSTRTRSKLNYENDESSEEDSENDDVDVLETGESE